MSERKVCLGAQRFADSGKSIVGEAGRNIVATEHKIHLSYGQTMVQCLLMAFFPFFSSNRNGLLLCLPIYRSVRYYLQSHSFLKREGQYKREQKIVNLKKLE